ncbi:hypothetical protein FC959_00120 [Clostridium botulinum]|nr:hypothetical protein [Clostridium botulinum]
MSSDENNLKNIFNPEILNENLKFISLYIAVYEKLKETIVGGVKDFYCSGFKGDKYIYDRYEEKVLNKVSSKKNRKLKASLKWLLDAEAIDKKDCESFKKITNKRNELVHDMSEILFNGLDEEVVILFGDMMELFKKIEKWWIKEVEVPISGEFTADEYEKIDWDSVEYSDLMMLRVITDVSLNDDREYINKKVDLYK